jgi:hypothetical protein
MSPVVARVAGMVLEVDMPAETPQPVGLLIGEQPGTGHNPRLPLWPYPPNSAGDRLFQMSGMPIEQYLTRLARVNMAHQPVGKWNAHDAAARLYALALGLPDGARVVLCGARARNAYAQARAVDMPWFEVDGNPLGHDWVAIPHPSGRNLAYRDPENVARARRVLRWAAGVED